jgi:hypothetical protein
MTLRATQAAPFFLAAFIGTRFRARARSAS